MYAALGLRVLPLHPGSKFPPLKNWPQRASRYPQVFSRWFLRQPEANLGLATGQGIVALDVDHGKGGKDSLAKLTRGRPLPRTAEAATGGGGKHFLFRVPPGVRVRNGQDLRPGIDIRGDGGMIVVEPSVHPDTGREYVWLVHPGQVIADAPDWLAAFLRAHKRWEASEPATIALPRGMTRLAEPDRSGDEAVLLAEMIERFPVTGHGQRND